MTPRIYEAANARPLFVLTHEFQPQRGGIATYCEEMARAAGQGEVAGVKGVEVWAPALPQGEHEGENRPFAVRRLPLRGSHGWKSRLTLARFLVMERRRLRNALVHLAEPGPMLAAMGLQPWLRLERMILTFHGSEILRFHANPLRRALTRRLIKQAWRVSTLSNYTRRLLCEHFPEASGKVVVAPGAPLSRRTGANEIGIEKTDAHRRLVVLTVGRLHPRKGQDRTLAALMALPDELRRRVEYRLAGTTNRPAYAADLRELAARAEALGIMVRFLGDVADEELGRAYAEADVFALTPVRHGQSVEGFGLVYPEAAAHGLPVVGHDVGGVPEAVAAGETGLLASPDSPSELTAAFVRLLGDAELRRRMGEAGRERAGRMSWRESARLVYANFNDRKPARGGAGCQ